MGTSQGLPERGQRALTFVVYLVLFVLGILLGVIGSFQYPRGPVPLVAIVLDLAIFVTCLLGGWGDANVSRRRHPRRRVVVASFVLSMPDSQGSVIITATAAGEWYLYGGALAAAAGGAAAFILWARCPKTRLADPDRVNSPGVHPPPSTPQSDLDRAIGYAKAASIAQSRPLGGIWAAAEAAKGGERRGSRSRRKPATRSGPLV